MTEAMQVLGWWELSEDEQPPEEIWGLDDQLEAWWAGVDAARSEKYGTSPGGSSEPMETVPTMQNEYARELMERIK